MKILLDNIIFSLQNSGGISVVWQQHLEKILQDKEFLCNFLEYDNSESNFFRKKLMINKEFIDVKNSKFIFLERYLDLKAKDEEKHIFHSSYYRVEKGKSTLNVTTVHDFTYEYFVKGFAQKVHSWQKKRALYNSDGIICVSENTKRDLLNFFPNISKKKIHVIYNGVDVEFKYLPADIAFEKKHPFSDYGYAMYVGDRRSLYKNFNMAVDACALSKLPMLIIGGGELTNKEEYNLTSKLGKSNYLNLLKVDAKDLNYFYNKAHCLLYPSSYEGFGIPIAEAQQAGCPVITTNSSSIPEVIANNYFAIVDSSSKKISEKMNELSVNFNLRNETLEMGFEKAKKFSWEKTYEQTKEFYKDLYK